MPKRQLAGRRVLIVEDEYYLASDARELLTGLGAEVLGPVATVEAAREAINTELAIDSVLLDINLRGQMAFDVADTLTARGIPFAFVTGYDRTALPERFTGATSIGKPVRPEQLAALVGSLTGGGPRPTA